jgi:hypothetical protein
MSTRTIAAAVAATALLGPPAAAVARPLDQGPQTTGPRVNVAAPVAAAAQPGGVHDGGGAGTITVLAIAGGTLLAGAATGFEGSRALTRRRALG